MFKRFWKFKNIPASVNNTIAQNPDKDSIDISFEQSSNLLLYLDTVVYFLKSFAKDPENHFLFHDSDVLHTACYGIRASTYYLVEVHNHKIDTAKEDQDILRVFICSNKTLGIDIQLDIYQHISEMESKRNRKGLFSVQSEEQLTTFLKENLVSFSTKQDYSSTRLIGM